MIPTDIIAETQEIAGELPDGDSERKHALEFVEEYYHAQHMGQRGKMSFALQMMRQFVVHNRHRCGVTA